MTIRTGPLAKLAVAIALCGTGGCWPSSGQKVQGYVEGEYVYVSSPLAGTLQRLNVERGALVNAHDPLFALDDTPERAARDEAARRVELARANLDDSKKGKRPSEMQSLQAQLDQSRAVLALSEKDLDRMEKLNNTGAASAQDIDRTRSQVDEDRQRVAQLEADVKTGQLGARADQIVAAEQEVKAREAALVQAEWTLSQKQQAAPQAGQVFDTLYRQGEWVAAGRPIVSLLPPGNIKVRAFVPEPQIGAIHLGEQVSVSIDGVASAVNGKVSFISPQAEYTPPVIYSNESRAKLVFMIELVFDPKIAANLHPGQPVDVRFDS